MKEQTKICKRMKTVALAGVQILKMKIWAMKRMMTLAGKLEEELLRLLRLSLPQDLKCLKLCIVSTPSNLLAGSRKEMTMSNAMSLKLSSIFSSQLSFLR
jgi:hypothetical protein